MTSRNLCAECHVLKGLGFSVYDRIREHAKHKQQARAEAAKRAEQALQAVTPDRVMDGGFFHLRGHRP